MYTCIESNMGSFNSFEHFVCLCGDLSVYLESVSDLLYLNAHNMVIVKDILVCNRPLESEFIYLSYGIYYMPLSVAVLIPELINRTHPRRFWRAK